MKIWIVYTQMSGHAYKTSNPVVHSPLGLLLDFHSPHARPITSSSALPIYVPKHIYQYRRLCVIRVLCHFLSFGDRVVPPSPPPVGDLAQPTAARAAVFGPEPWLGRWAAVVEALRQPELRGLPWPEHASAAPRRTQALQRPLAQRMAALARQLLQPVAPRPGRRFADPSGRRAGDGPSQPSISGRCAGLCQW
jgi:hypothetical protein